MTRAWYLGTCLLMGGCLQPVGFPWSQADTGTTTGEPTPEATDPTATGATSGSTAPGSTSEASSTTDLPSTSTSTSTTAGSTGDTGPAPSCGDGQLDPGEDCDDGNDVDSDGCNQHCGRDRLIFVTSSTYSGDHIGGLSGGDAICQDAAAKAMLPHAPTFKAWLSDSVTDAVDRFTHHEGRYVRVDGLVVAHGFADLLDGELENPILVTEHGGVYKAGVWTGTQIDGTRGIGPDHCGDWTLADAFDMNNGGFYGFAQSWDQRWTFEPNPDINPGPCGGELALYCIED